MADLPDGSAPSANPFDQFVETPGSGKQANDDNPFNEFVEPGKTLAAPQGSFGGAFSRNFARSVVPAAGGLVGAGAGAEAGAALGLLGGPFAGVTVPVAGAIGGVLGFFGGSYATEAAQHYALKQAPDSWQDALGMTDRQQRLDEQQHPIASFLGGLLPYALTMRPGGFARSALPENAGAFDRLMANPATKALFGGGTMGGLELYNESQTGAYDWRKVAIATGFGVVWNKPTKFGEAITEVGARPARAGIEAIKRPFSLRGTSIGENDYAPYTIQMANGAQVIGPGVTEEVFRGSEQRDANSKMVAQQMVRTEQQVTGRPETPGPDVHQIVRQLEPETFERYDALQQQRDTLDRWLENFRNPADDELARLQAERDAIQGEGGFVPPRGVEGRRYRARLRTADAEYKAALERRQAYMEGGLEYSPEALQVQQRRMVVDEQMRDMAGDVSAAYRRANEAIQRGEVPAAPAEAPAAPAAGPAAPAAVPEAPAPVDIAQGKAAIIAHAFRKWIAAGRTVEEARAAAEIEAERFVTRASRFRGALGTAADLYAKEGVRVQGAGGQPSPPFTPPGGAAPARPAPAAAAAPPERAPAAAAASPRIVESGQPLIVDGKPFGEPMLRATFPPEEPPVSRETAILPPKGYEGWTVGKEVSLGPLKQMTVEAVRPDGFILRSKQGQVWDFTPPDPKKAPKDENSVEWLSYAKQVRQPRPDVDVAAPAAPAGAPIPADAQALAREALAPRPAEAPPAALPEPYVVPEIAPLRENRFPVERELAQHQALQGEAFQKGLPTGRPPRGWQPDPDLQEMAERLARGKSPVAPGKRPLSLSEFVRRSGGIKRGTGEADDLIAQDRGDLTRTNGRGFDDMAELARDSGFNIGPDTGIGNGVDHDRFMEMLHEDSSGRQKHYSDTRETDEFLSRQRLNEVYEEELQRMGLKLKGMAPRDIAWILSHDEGAQRALYLANQGRALGDRASLEMVRLLDRENARAMEDSRPEPGAWEMADHREMPQPTRAELERFYDDYERASGIEGPGGQAARGQEPGAERPDEAGAGPASGGEPAKPAEEPPATGRAGLETEATAQGQQTLLPGVKPVGARERAEAEMQKPLQGGNKPPPAGGLFDEGARNQKDLFQLPPEYAREGKRGVGANENDRTHWLPQHYFKMAKTHGDMVNFYESRADQRAAEARSIIERRGRVGPYAKSLLESVETDRALAADRRALRDEYLQRVRDYEPEPQANYEQSAKGKIRVTPGQQSIITLMKDADASTVIHELWHDFFEQLMRDAEHPQAPPGMRDDAQTIYDALKVNGREEVKTRHHEQVARWGEQYLREGRAPSAGLAGVFQQFKTWLTNIYQTIKGLGRPISDDVRKVFDRMLAEEPQQAVIAPDRAPMPTLADVQRADARETEPAQAEPVMDRIVAENQQAEARVPPEVQNEIQAVLPEAEATVEARGEAGAGAEPAGGVGGGGQPPGAEPAGGGVGEGDGGKLGGGGAAGPKGASAPAGGAAGGPERARADAGPPLSPAPADTFGPGESPLVDKAGNIRLENLTNGEDVRQAIREAAEANNDFIGDRQGVVTDQQVDDLAAAAGMQGAEKLAAARIRGQAFNAVEVMTLRKALIQSATEVNAAMKQAALSSATDQDVLWYAMVRDRHQLLQATVSQATAEAGRALRAFRNISEEQAGGTDEYVRQATGRTLFQLREEAKLGAKLDTPEKVSKFIADSQKPGFGRMLLEYWINNLISGPATHTTYAIGNTILALQKAGPETLAAAMIGRAREAMGQQRETVRYGEVGAQLRGAARGFLPAVHASTEALRSGMTTLLPGEEGRRLQFLQPGVQGTVAAPVVNEAARAADVMQSTFGVIRGMRDAFIAAEPLLDAAGNPQSLPLIGTQHSPLGAIPDVRVGGAVVPLGTVQRLPSRMVAAIHSFFRVMNYSMEKSALAYRGASNEGLAGTAFDARVGELWQNPTPAIMEEARTTATDLTLMGQGSKFTQALSRLTNTEVFGFPILKFIDPFVHISSNVIDQSLIKRTPIGWLSPELRADLMGKNGNIAQDKAQARMLVGTALATTIGGLAAQGLASGSGPTDPREAAMWRLAGNQAHSVRIGDTWYDAHRLGPLGMLMSVGADMYEVAHLVDKAEFAKAAAHLQHALTQNVLDESFMRGPSDLIKAIEDPGRYGEAYIRNFLSSFIPFSVGMSQEARAIDPYSREARTVVDAMRAKIPFMSMDLLPRVDIWGQPMPNRDAFLAPGVTSLYAQRMSQDPVNLAMVELGVHPAPVERKIRNVELTDAQHLRFAQMAGRMSKSRLDVIVQSPDWQHWDPQTKRDIVQAVVRQSREVARAQIMAADPTIVQRATAAKLDKLRH